MLQELFKSTLAKYTHNDTLINEYWDELEKQYRAYKRHYHNLTHLENLYKQLKTVTTIVKDWDVIIFALFYHDAIYNTTKTDNEEKSAKLAQKRLCKTKMSKEQLSRCYEYIIATKSHQRSTDNDCNLFTDADLSILASEWNDYVVYTKQIRQEYRIYPNLIYTKGRIRVLTKLLSLEQLYKTPHFFSLYEEKARMNLKQELDALIQRA